MEIGKDLSQAYVEKAKADSEAERKERNSSGFRLPCPATQPMLTHKFRRRAGIPRKKKEINYRIYGYQA